MERVLKKITEPAYDFRSMIENSARRNSEKDYLIYKRRGGLESLNYGGLEERVRSFCEGLVSLGISGKSVAVIGETSPEWIITYLATVVSGGIIVPLDKELSREAVCGFIQKVGCGCVVFSRKFRHYFEGQEADFPTVDYFVEFDGEKEPSVACASSEDMFLDFVELLNLGRTQIESGASHYDEFPVDLEKTCAVIFTSGTTGTSKGVMLSQKNLIHAINGSYRCTGFETDDVVMSVLPIHHTYEMTCGILTPLFIGATVCINDSLKYIVRNFQLFKPTGAVLVPLFVTTVYKKIWDNARKTGKEKILRGGIAVSGVLKKVKIDPSKLLFKSVREVFGGRLTRIICGGAPMPAELVASFDAFGIKLCQGYGITECAPLISVCTELDNRAGSVGQPIPGVTVKIEDAEEQDGRMIGEIVVKGHNVMKGYFEDEEATAAVLQGAWFRTGDYGYLDEDGFVYITGRKKNVIVLNNGKNVFPEEIEEYLLKIELIKECVVVGRNGEDHSVTVTAIIFPDFARAEELGIGSDLNEVGGAIKEEIATLNRSLPSFKQIRGIEMRRTEFEKNTSKKIIRYKIQ